MGYLNLTSIIILAEIIITLMVIMIIVFTISLTKSRKATKTIKKFIDDLDEKTIINIEFLDKLLGTSSAISPTVKDKVSQTIEHNEKQLIYKIFKIAKNEEESVLKDINGHIYKINKSYLSLISLFVKKEKTDSKSMKSTLTELDYKIKVAEETIELISEEYIKLFKSKQTQLDLENSKTKFISTFENAIRKLQE